MAVIFQKQNNEKLMGQAKHIPDDETDCDDVNWLINPNQNAGVVPVDQNRNTNHNQVDQILPKTLFPSQQIR